MEEETEINTDTSNKVAALQAEIKNLQRQLAATNPPSRPQLSGSSKPAEPIPTTDQSQRQPQGAVPWSVSQYKNMDNTENILLAMGTIAHRFKRCNQPSVKRRLRRKLLQLYALYNVLTKNGCQKKRQFWVRMIFSEQRRLLQGASNNLVKEMQQNDEEKFRNYFRMDSVVLKKLFDLVGPLITKNSNVRKAISAETRLYITVRYLAEIAWYPSRMLFALLTILCQK
ncbi:PREDICTED: uncharacterized protein LOC108780545 [Cyphomyrmex costatus]|uniref:uncharacterized protein LOC108780545 n=1 Tax=Cyphomyrmex costatus TaxID=456900 RepID=UPI0008522CA2|nr:PREDICTED: uncharacterized protein LOC108780545 [Cyphomyrmex costatus]